MCDGRASSEGDTPPAAADDWRLLALVADGELDAFETLVERHQGRLHAVAVRLLGDPEEARDAVQTVFVRLFQKAATFEPRAKLSTLLYRMTTNHCLNRLRRRRAIRMLPLSGAGEDPESPGWDPPDAGANPHRRLEARERWERTRRAIDRLPATQRSVLVLARFEGLSYRQIAEVLDITVSAVESRLFRAMRSLAAAQDEEI